MIWNRLLMYALFTIGITGSSVYAVMYVLVHFLKIRNPYFLLSWQKVVVTAFTFPAVFCAAFLSRVNWGGRSFGTIGIFWTVRSPGMDEICLILEIVWLAGLLVKAVNAAGAQRRLRLIWKENQPVHNGRWEAIFEEYRERFGLPEIGFFQNGLIPSPVSAWQNGPMIVIPDKEYTEKEICMILAHEMNHIKYRDLFWRKYALVSLWINWYNPLVHLLFEQMVSQQEIACDMRCSSSPDFSQKEYGCFLVSLTDSEAGNLCLTSLFESKKILIRRLQMMTQARKVKKPNRWKVIITCAALITASLIPAGAVSAQVMETEEQRMFSQETVSDHSMVKAENTGVEIREKAGTDVTEADLTEKNQERSNTVFIDDNIPANTRVIYRYENLSAGDKISISAGCKDVDATFRVGVKEQNRGDLSYIEGKDVIIYIYEVTEDGSYSAYVENRSSKTLKITGSAIYQY